MKNLVSNFVSTVVQVNSSSGFIRYEANSNEYIYFDKSAFVSEDNKPIVDLTKVVKFGSAVKCNVVETPSGNCKYVATKVWLCKESELPPKKSSNAIHNKHIEPKNESTEVDPDDGKSYIEGIGKLVCIVNGGVGFINKEQHLSKGPNNIYFTTAVVILSDGSKFSGDLEKYLHVGDEVSYKAEPTKRGVSCKWRALEVSKLSSVGIVVPKAVDESTMVYNRRGTIVNTFPSKGIISLGNRGFKDGVFFEISTYFEDGERVNNLLHHLKPGDSVMVDCYKDIPTKSTHWKAYLVWTGIKPDASKYKLETSKLKQERSKPKVEMSNTNLEATNPKPVYNSCDQYEEEIYYSENDEEEILLDFSKKRLVKHEPGEFSEDVGKGAQEDLVSSVKSSSPSEDWEGDLNVSSSATAESIKPSVIEASSTEQEDWKTGFNAAFSARTSSNEGEDWEAELNEFPPLNNKNNERPADTLLKSIASLPSQETVSFQSCNSTSKKADITSKYSAHISLLNDKTSLQEISASSHMPLSINMFSSSKVTESQLNNMKSSESVSVEHTYSKPALSLNQQSSGLNPMANPFSMEISNKTFSEINSLHQNSTALDLNSKPQYTQSQTISQLGPSPLSSIQQQNVLPLFGAQHQQPIEQQKCYEMQLTIPDSIPSANVPLIKPNRQYLPINIQNPPPTQQYLVRPSSEPSPFQHMVQSTEPQVRQQFINELTSRSHMYGEQNVPQLHAAQMSRPSFPEPVPRPQMYKESLIDVQNVLQMNKSECQVDSICKPQLYAELDCKPRPYPSAMARPQQSSGPIVTPQQFTGSINVPQLSSGINNRPHIPLGLINGNQIHSSFTSSINGSQLQMEPIVRPQQYRDFNSQPSPDFLSRPQPVPIMSSREHLVPIIRPQQNITLLNNYQSNPEHLIGQQTQKESMTNSQPQVSFVTKPSTMTVQSDATSNNSQDNPFGIKNIFEMLSNNTSSKDNSLELLMACLMNRLCSDAGKAVTGLSLANPLLTMMIQMSNMGFGTNDSTPASENKCHTMHNISTQREYKELVGKCEQSWMKFMTDQLQLAAFIKDKLINNPCMCCQKNDGDFN